MRMDIQKARVQDIPQIVRLYAKLMRQHWQYEPLYQVHAKAWSDYRKFLKQYILNRNACILVAHTATGRIVGFMSCVIHKRMPRFRIKKAAYIYDVYIEKQYQGKGIGYAMLSVLKQWAKDRGICWIKLEVSPQNKSAFLFWKKSGFHVFQHKMAQRI
ncbi:MAG: GNAT family N-acetyltransferase [Elusimicrobia bacterium]|nr:GNAT family N-acetyltransferase [Elusimicrobiota bacterium]MBD3411933.1 GNAT family N-acetyltransferase [Elusimicrobiota bacterium]